MVQDRKDRGISSDIFVAPEEETDTSHDVGGAISDIVNEDTEQEDMLTVGSLDASRVESDVAEEADVVPVEVGVDVVGSCGHKLGEVVDVRQDHIVVEKGFFVPEDVYVPKTAIAAADEHHLTLNVTRSAAEQAGWGHDPDGVENEDVIEDAEERL